MSYPPRKGDRSAEAILAQMEDVVAQGGHAFVKWTCPACGERVMSNVPDVFNTEGYLHEAKTDNSPCGAVYYGDRFGLAVLWPLGKEAQQKLSDTLAIDKLLGHPMPPPKGNPDDAN